MGIVSPKFRAKQVLFFYKSNSNFHFMDKLWIWWLLIRGFADPEITETADTRLFPNKPGRHSERFSS